LDWRQTGITLPSAVVVVYLNEVIDCPVE